ncbi:ParA family protein [Bradyrhizobium arachidis]|uniref:ParA family protein n=1 Tax=Bradyrhizobium arachidis TaxID=858423 RepID=UPI0021632F33|nr:ParA family protein [Bradyrhizobium arachidis]
MIVAVLNQKGRVGKATLALHLAGEWASRGKRVTPIDADPQGSALDWSQQRARENVARLFGSLVSRATPSTARQQPKIRFVLMHIGYHHTSTSLSRWLNIILTPRTTRAGHGLLIRWRAFAF